MDAGVWAASDQGARSDRRQAQVTGALKHAKGKQFGYERGMVRTGGSWHSAHDVSVVPLHF